MKYKEPSLPPTIDTHSEITPERVETNERELLFKEFEKSVVLADQMAMHLEELDSMVEAFLKKPDETDSPFHKKLKSITSPQEYQDFFASLDNEITQLDSTFEMLFTQFENKKQEVLTYEPKSTQDIQRINVMLRQLNAWYQVLHDTKSKWRMLQSIQEEIPNLFRERVLLDAGIELMLPSKNDVLQKKKELRTRSKKCSDLLEKLRNSFLGSLRHRKQIKSLEQSLIELQKSIAACEQAEEVPHYQKPVEPLRMPGTSFLVSTNYNNDATLHRKLFYGIFRPLETQILEHYKLPSRQNGDQDSHLRLMTDLLSLEDHNRMANLFATKYFDKHKHILTSYQGTPVIGRGTVQFSEFPINSEMWRGIKKELIENKQISNEEFDKAEEKLKELLLCSMSTSSNRRQESHNLFAVSSPRAIPFVVFNAFREPGSGEYPFVSIHQTSSDQTILFSYIAALSPRQIEEAQQQNIPGFNEILALIKKNPKTFSQKVIGEKANPIPIEIEHHLAELAAHFVKNGTGDEKLVALDFFENERIGLHLRRGTETVAELLKMETTPEIINKAIKILFFEAIRGESRALEIYLDFLDTTSPEVASSITTKTLEFIEPIFDHLKHFSPLVDRFARTLGYSGQQLIVAHDFLTDLRTVFSYMFSPESLPELIKISENPQIMQMIRELHKEGGFYLNNSTSLLILESIFEDKENILFGIREIQKYYPHFTYYPTLHRRLNPYDLFIDTTTIGYEETGNPLDDLHHMTFFIEKICIAFEKKTEMSQSMRSALRELISTSLIKDSPANYLQSSSKFLSLWKETYGEFPDIKWRDSYRRIEKLQAPAARAEYDPWRTDLAPLINDACDKKLLSKENPDDGELLVDFVKKYGMYNIPTLLEWHVELSRAQNPNGISDTIRPELEELLGVNLTQVFESKRCGKKMVVFRQIISEKIQEYKNEIQRKLLVDEIPEEIIHSKVGQELFASLKGSTRWGRSESPSELISLWKETAVTHPELATIPEGYKEVAFEVPAMSRRERTTDEQKTFLEQENKIMDDNDSMLWFEKFDTSFGKEPNYSKITSALLQWADEQIVALRKKKEAIANPKAKESIESQIKELSLSHQKLSSVTIPKPRLEKNPPQDASEAINFLNTLITIFPKKIRPPMLDDSIRLVSAFHMRSVMGLSFPEWNRELIDFMAPVFEMDWENQDAVNNRRYSRRTINFWSEFLTNFLNEHYLNPAQDDHTTGHPPFSKELLDELQHRWGVSEGTKKHKLVQVAEKLRRLESGDKEESDKTISISMIPSKGVMRIFSGDIGDACYTSQHTQLAKGEYQGITSYTFVTGRGSDNERMRGSVLAIESQTPEGEKVLVVRANNPQESLLSGVDSEKLIEKTLEIFKELARARGIDTLVVPLDPASSSCSNRLAVAQYYKKHFSTRPTVGLVNNPETNFNGYDIWNKVGVHPLVSVPK